MISSICKQYGITNYTINPDGSIDVNDNVFLNSKRLTELPLRFNRVTGYFDCDNNNLTSLKGSPRWVGSSFSCNYNCLTSLEFGPDYVSDGFYCEGNYLTDNYCDTEIGGGFYTSLKQYGLTEENYKEFQKMYKRKMILDDIFDM